MGYGKRAIGGKYGRGWKVGNKIEFSTPSFLFFIILQCVLFFDGCFTTYISAPNERGQYILGASHQLTWVRVKSKSWYMFWGLLPLGKNSTDEIIKKLPSGYRIVKVKVSLDATSFFVALITLGLVSSTTIIVEGVPPPISPQNDFIEPIPATLPP